ncbi:MAG: hypothetical protein OJF49_004326 [Ktedonobacterales bacterium]|jgi:hypothetical protein|nr:MAG: hypothetical protein OJF49_004326 [Ktedonobacterales bacterium]
MPNKYQREIEEILRNMERTEPRQGLGDRVRAFNRPRERAPRAPRLSLTRVEVLYIVGIALIMIAAGLTFYASGQFFIFETIPLSGILAVLGFITLVLGLLLGWRERVGGPSPSRPAPWRNNVVEMTPRRGPFSAISTQFRIMRLKLRYRRMRGHGDE